MARNTNALVMAVSVMFSNNLYECGPVDGYKFPVYTTASCPKNKAEWLERSFGLNCTDQNGYMCIPNEMITDLVEFCYTKEVAIPEGVCLFLNKRSSAVDAYRCQKFSYGCPSYQYFSNGIYEHQSCVSIMEGCFLADPYCERTVTSNRKTTTSKYNTEKGIGTNSITTGTPFPAILMIIIVTIISSLIAGYCLKLGITKIIKRISETSGGEASTGSASDPTTKQFKLDNIKDMLLEGPRAGGKKSSFNRNANQGPLTNHASDQTTKLLIPDSIQDMPFEGPSAGGERSSLNRNSNPGPLMNRASDQTTDLLIPDNIQDESLEGPRAESSLNENSNQRPRTNHASVQTTELFIPDNIQVMPLEGPRAAGGQKSSLNWYSNPGPLTKRVSDQTTELLIPYNIQDKPLEGPRAGSKESLNQNSNPGPLTDRASDQTTEPLIPTNIQDTPLEGKMGRVQRAVRGAARAASPIDNVYE